MRALVTAVLMVTAMACVATTKSTRSEPSEPVTESIGSTEATALADAGVQEAQSVGESGKPKPKAGQLSDPKTR